MSRDRFILWKGKPSRAEIKGLLDEFFGSGFPVEWGDDSGRWIISIPGTPSPTVGGHPSPYREERFIEAIPMKHSNSCDFSVLTRQADPLVNAIADGLAEYLCFRLGGKLDMGG